VFEQVVPRKMFAPKREKIRGGRRKSHDEGLNDLYSSLVNFRVMKYKRVRGTGYSTRTGEKIISCRVLVGDLKKETLWKK